MFDLAKRSRAARAHLGPVAVLAIIAAAMVGAPPEARASGVSVGGKCGTPLRTLVPAKRTAPPVMIFRINQALNVGQYEGIKDLIRRNDIFLVNTRFEASDPGEWTAIVDELSTKFPCNRIVALNGVSSNEDVPGYAYALASDERLWGYGIDWESMDWNAARALVPSLPSWTDAFGPTRKRIRTALTNLSDSIARPKRPVGVVPAPYPHWDYGLIAKTLDGVNERQRLLRSGFQSVQTQGSCDRPPGIVTATSRLHDQYVPPVRVVRKRKGKRIVKRRIKKPPRSATSRLSIQISFSNNPNPSAGMPIKRVSVAQAATCTAQAVGAARRARAILYWANPDSIGELLSTPRVRALRGKR